MTEQIRISAKDLGELALPDFCPRCFWFKRHAPSGLPFQIFPGVFSSIDSYSKRIVHSWFDEHGASPLWLSSLGNVTGYVDPPHHSKFWVVDSQHNIRLTGTPDGILTRSDNSYVIIDYKTAKLTTTQDRLFPMYEIQLNVYARIAEECGLSPVGDLALVYTEPVTDGAASENMCGGDGFLMRFEARVVRVERRPEAIAPLLEKARQICDLAAPLAGRPGCKDCRSLQALFDISR